jgi:hypothetical protein
MKQSFDNVLRAVFLLLLFVPTPLAVVGTTPAEADSPAQIVAADPAVLIPEQEEEADDDPWTARFLGPAVVAIAVIGVGATVSYYVVSIRGRYRVVQ